MPEQIITNKQNLKFYSEKPYEYNWDKEPGEKNPFMYKFFVPLAHIILNKKFDMEFYGAENVPTDRPLLLASNHVAGIDPIAITYCLTKSGTMKTMYFMAKEEFFHTFYTKIPLLVFGGFPVKRGTSDRNSLNYSIKVLKNGHRLLVFPEGTRNLERTKPTEGKAGIALIAREAKVDILPISIYRSKTVEGKKDKYIIRFNEIIPYEELGLGDKPKSKELRSATELIMEKIGESWEIDAEK